MRKLFLLAFLIAAWQMPASATITVGGTPWTGTVTTGALTVTVAPTNGHSLWVGCQLESTTVTINSFVDNNSTALHQDTLVHAGDAVTLIMYHEDNVTGVTSFTVTPSTNVNPLECIALDIGGLVTSSSQDVFLGSVTKNNAGPYLSGSINTVNANDIVIGIASHDNNGAYNLTTSGSWTAVPGTQLTAMYQVVSSATAWNPAGVNGSSATMYGTSGSYKGPTSAAIQHAPPMMP